MLKGLFPGAHVRAVAKVIDETIHAALHLHETTGSSPHRFFLNHPMKTNHNIMDQGASGKTHQFYLSGPGGLDLHVMAHEGTPHFVMVMPQGDFLGAVVQASTKGRYLVRMDRPLTQPIGRHARRLLDVFVKAYDAADTTG